MITEKTCSKCDEVLPVVRFHKDSRTKDGYHALCKTCRRGDKKKRRAKVMINPDLKIWLTEFRRVCVCAVCGDAPTLGKVKTVDEARAALRASLPRCRKHQDVSTLKMRLREKAWKRDVEQVIQQIDIYHDITVSVKRFPHDHKREGADRWLKGFRDDATDELVDLMKDYFERTIDPEVKELVAERHTVVTNYKKKQIAYMEDSIEKMTDDLRAKLGSEDADINALDLIVR